MIRTTAQYDPPLYEADIVDEDGIRVATVTRIKNFVTISKAENVIVLDLLDVELLAKAIENARRAS